MPKECKYNRLEMFQTLKKEVAKRGQPMTATELATMFGCHKSTISNMLAKYLPNKEDRKLYINYERKVCNDNKLIACATALKNKPGRRCTINELAQFTGFSKPTIVIRFNRMPPETKQEYLLTQKEVLSLRKEQKDKLTWPSSKKLTKMSPEIPLDKLGIGQCKPNSLARQRFFANFASPEIKKNYE